MKTYTGSCQCGAITFEAEADLQSVISCNCSRCSRMGFLLSFIPAASFKLLSGENNLTEYLFNKHMVRHLFCKSCGVQSFARGKGKDGAEMVALNVRCIPEVDVKSLTVTEVDGKSA